jgi:hypothetical protein
MSESAKNNHELFQEHAAVGYANAQETIRFLDTKAGALIGLVTLVTGLPLVITQWILDKDDTSPFCLSSLQGNHPILTNSLAVILFAGLAAGVTSLWCALEVTIARPASHKRKPCKHACSKHYSHKRRANVLFPAGGSYNDRAYILRKASAGLTAIEINREFGTQLLRVGNITGKKVRYLRNAVKAFQVQLALNVVCLGACFLAYVVMLTAQMGSQSKSRNKQTPLIPAQAVATASEVPPLQLVAVPSIKFAMPPQPHTSDATSIRQDLRPSPAP